MIGPLNSKRLPTSTLRLGGIISLLVYLGEYIAAYRFILRASYAPIHSNLFSTPNSNDVWMQMQTDRNDSKAIVYIVYQNNRILTSMGLPTPDAHFSACDRFEISSSCCYPPLFIKACRISKVSVWRYSVLSMISVYPMRIKTPGPQSTTTW